jgi:riboflavin-specific deaminase-like protein
MRSGPEHDTIVVGANTVRHDDPQLTVRGVRAGSRQPLRVVVSASLDLPQRAKLFGKALARGTVVATLAPEELPVRARRAHELKAARLARRGVSIWFLPKGEGGVALDVLLRRLAVEDRHDVLVEGGPTLGAQLADRGLVDELWLFVSPKLLGEGGRAVGLRPQGDEPEGRLGTRARAHAAGGRGPGRVRSARADAGPLTCSPGWSRRRERSSAPSPRTAGGGSSSPRRSSGRGSAIGDSVSVNGCCQTVVATTAARSRWSPCPRRCG